MVVECPRPLGDETIEATNPGDLIIV